MFVLLVNGAARSFVLRRVKGDESRDPPDGDAAWELFGGPPRAFMDAIAAARKWAHGGEWTNWDVMVEDDA